MSSARALTFILRQKYKQNTKNVRCPCTCPCNGFLIPMFTHIAGTASGEAADAGCRSGGGELVYHGWLGTALHNVWRRYI